MLLPRSDTNPFFSTSPMLRATHRLFLFLSWSVSLTKICHPLRETASLGSEGIHNPIKERKAFSFSFCNRQISSHQSASSSPHVSIPVPRKSHSHICILWRENPPGINGASEQQAGADPAQGKGNTPHWFQQDLHQLSKGLELHLTYETASNGFLLCVYLQVSALIPQAGPTE